MIQEGTWAYASVSTQLSALSSYFCIVLAGFLTGSLSQPHFSSSEEEVISGYFTHMLSTSSLPWDPFSTTATQHAPRFASLSLVSAQTILFQAVPALHQSSQSETHLIAFSPGSAPAGCFLESCACYPGEEFTVAPFAGCLISREGARAEEELGETFRVLR